MNRLDKIYNNSKGMVKLMLNEEKDRLVNLVSIIKKLCNRLLEVNNKELQAEILTKCQESTIAIGDSLEKCVYEYDIEMIKNKNIISELEKFCESIYLCTKKTIVQQDVINLVSDLDKIEQLIREIPVTYRIVFLPYKAAMWDSLESIWRAFYNDKRCETTVVPIPYFEANRKTNEWEAKYDGDKYPDYVPVTYFQDYLLGDKKPDVVFMHYPFDNINHVTTMHPAYFSEELKKNCKKLAYVPYYVNAGFISDVYIDLPLLHRADYLFFQSERAKESCKGYDYYDRIQALGSPKFDKIIRLVNNRPAAPEDWNIDLSGKKALMLNTTITDFLENGELLMNKLRYLFDVVGDYNNLVIVWRPHPLLEGTVKAMRPQYIEKYTELVNYYVQNNIGIFDESADISTAIALCDGYIGSRYSSIIDLFEVSGKPIYLFDSKHIYNQQLSKDAIKKSPEDVFLKKSELGYFACEESYEYSIYDFMEDIINDKLASIKKKQVEAVKNIASNMDGTAGEKIHKFIIDDLDK